MVIKLAATCMGDNLDSQIDSRFGRGQYFLIVDPETMQFEAVQNPNIQAGSGAGIATAQMIAQKGVDTVLTGNVGPNAYQTLSSAGIKVVTGASGTIRQVIEQYKNGQFQTTQGPRVGAHFGMRAGIYPVRGGRGRDMGFPQAPFGPGQMGPSTPMSKKDELSPLKRQAEAIED